MVSGPPQAHRLQPWFMPTFLVFGVVLGTILLYLTPMYFVGKRYESERQFLRNYRTPNDFEAFASYCMIYAKDSSEPNDVVFIGDSSCRCDLRTLQFQELSGLKAYNLGSMGLLGLDGNRRILETYLLHHPRPRAVVLCMLPQAVGLPTEIFTPEYARDVKPRFDWCFGSKEANSRPPDESFLFNSRQGIRSTYGSFVGGADHFLHQPIPFWRGDTFLTLKADVERERGFWQVPGQFHQAPAKQPSKADPFSVTDEFKVGLTALTKTCQQRGITLIIRLTPYSGECPEPSPSLRAWSKDLESREPLVHVIQPEVLPYPASDFADANHCAPSGVSRFTRHCAEEIKKLLDNPPIKQP